jgi:hypothetical protein
LIKNSVSKVIEDSNETAPVKSEVCLFKNIFNTDDDGIPRSIKARKRLRLEYAIKSKMQLLKRDWGEFLRCNYPELFSNHIISEENEKMH